MPVLASAQARVGALQLPGFREALGLPDQAEQVLSLRTQQVWMHETGIANYPDIFEGSIVIEGETARMAAAARKIIEEGLERGYSGTLEQLASLLSRRMSEWQASIESGEKVMVGVNKFEEGLPVARQPEPAPATVDTAQERIAALRAWRAERDADAWQAARDALIVAAQGEGSIIEPSVAFAKAGGTTGEWTTALQEVFGPRYAAPLGVVGAPVLSQDEHSSNRAAGSLRRPKRVLLAKAGLDGHVNALRLLAVALRQAGFEVVYAGPAQTPEAIAHTAVSEAVDVIGISSLSGAHRWVASALREALATRDATDIPVIMGGILPDEDHDALREVGVKAIFGPGTTLHVIIACIANLAAPT